MRQTKALGRALREVLRDNPKGKLEIIGYTDTDGKASYNQTLSERRAQAIRAFLQETYLPQTVTIDVEGRGERQPICTDAAPQNTKAMVITPASGLYDHNDAGEYRCKRHEDKQASHRVEVRFVLAP
jgi:outer membrane protein OmpA-like peptidoglycan-associated protein